MTITDPGETRAISIAGMSLAYALAGILKRMGALEPDAVDNALEAALSSVEMSFPANDRSAALARQLLDLMGGQLAHVSPIGLPSAAGAGWGKLPPRTSSVGARAPRARRRHPGAITP